MLQRSAKAKLEVTALVGDDGEEEIMDEAAFEAFTQSQATAPAAAANQPDQVLQLTAAPTVAVRQTAGDVAAAALNVERAQAAAAAAAGDASPALYLQGVAKRPRTGALVLDRSPEPRRLVDVPPEIVEMVGTTHCIAMF